MNGNNVGFARENIARETDGWLVRLHLTFLATSGWMGPIVGNRKGSRFHQSTGSLNLKSRIRTLKLISQEWTLKNTPMPLTPH